MNTKNKITRMMMDSSIVIVDGKTIKNKYGIPDIENASDIMRNIEDYHITFFNRDSNIADRVLILDTDYIL